MVKSVLCAVDLDQIELDTNVLKVAKKLADNADALLNVVTVLPDYGTSMVATFFKPGTEHLAAEHANEKLHDFVDEALGKDAEVRHIVAVGNVYEEILATAKKIEAGLIVIGAHKPSIQDYLLGPNAARVVRHASCSVFVVRA